EQEAQLRDRQLDAEIRKPADAQRYRVEQEAEGSKNAAIFEADAEKARRARMAEAVELEGRADAAAILAKGEAEAEARRKNAEAFSHYGDAAIIDLLTKILPDLVSAASEPISAIEKLTVISTDGASDLTRNVASNVEQGIQIGSDLTGLDLKALLGRLGTSSGEEG
ncbi:MAG: flotillin domain-containing protein, partial [Egicoccus sp.]